MARPGTEDLEGQRATHRPNTQGSSLTGVDTDHLDCPFHCMTIASLGLGVPIQ